MERPRFMSISQGRWPPNSNCPCILVSEASLPDYEDEFCPTYNTPRQFQSKHHCHVRQLNIFLTVIGLQTIGLLTMFYSAQANIADVTVQRPDLDVHVVGSSICDVIGVNFSYSNCHRLSHQIWQILTF